ncbi:MAG: SDR family NAD(P)-dependent oxidoreductase [Pyrinomonadaceae bacterium]
MTDKNERVAQTLPRELLRDQVAIITGGSRGIGRAAALRFAEAGTHVVVNYLQNEEAAESVAREVRAHHVEALIVRADVASANESTVLIEAAIERFGRIDALVANAGIWEGAPIEEMSEDLWDRVIDANLKGTWSVCRAAVPAMKQAGRGAIVIVSSTAGQRGEANYSNYAASKGGQISFTKALASELAPHIRVNSVAPGWVETEMNTDAFGDKEYERKVIEAIPLQRIAAADDIALAIVFLASDWARHITGEILNVNGGSVLCG